MVHASNPSTQEAEEGPGVQGQPRVKNKTLKNQTKRRRRDTVKTSVAKDIEVRVRKVKICINKIYIGIKKT
jgi:hypothetical protein